MTILIALFLIAHASPATATPLKAWHCYENTSEYNHHVIMILDTENSEYRYKLIANTSIGIFSNSHEVIEDSYPNEVRCPRVI